MSLKKKFKKYAKKALSLSTGGMLGGGSGDEGQRSEAAARLVNVNKKQQAGGGQIKYTGQEWQE